MNKSPKSGTNFFRELLGSKKPSERPHTAPARVDSAESGAQSLAVHITDQAEFYGKGIMASDKMKTMQDMMNENAARQMAAYQAPTDRLAGMAQSIAGYGGINSHQHEPLISAQDDRLIGNGIFERGRGRSPHQELSFRLGEYTQAKNGYVRDYLADHLPEGFENLADTVRTVFARVDEWREADKYVAEVVFLLDKEMFVYYKCRRTVAHSDGQTWPDILDVIGILTLTADECAMLAVTSA